MAVDVEGKADVGVVQEFLDVLRVDALPEQQRGTCDDELTYFDGDLLCPACADNAGVVQRGGAGEPRPPNKEATLMRRIVKLLAVAAVMTLVMALGALPVMAVNSGTQLLGTSPKTVF